MGIHTKFQLSSSYVSRHSLSLGIFSTAFAFLSEFQLQSTEAKKPKRKTCFEYVSQYFVERTSENEGFTFANQGFIYAKLRLGRNEKHGYLRSFHHKNRIHALNLTDNKNI